MQKEAFIRCVPGWYRCFFKLLSERRRYEHRTRKNAENKNAGMIAENVDKATAIRFAQRYCHRNEDNEGVMIAYHGTTVQPEGSEWWFH